jgi:large subunit ribosomal protein L21
MYAIIRAGGKQAKVREGDVIDVERIKEAGDEISFTPLLLVAEDGSVVSDREALQKASVSAKVIGESRGEKIDIFKYKNKTGYRRRQGHRQTYTRLEVTKIKGPKKAAAKKKAAAEKKTESDEEA